MNRQQLRSSVVESLPDVAVVLCSLICDYAYREPYEWKPLTDIRIVAGADQKKTNAPAKINGDRIVLTDATDFRSPWYTFVCNVELRYGCLRWTISGPADRPEMTVAGWLETGVTSNADHLYNTLPNWQGVSTNDNWIFGHLDLPDTIQLHHAGDCIDVRPTTATDHLFADYVQPTEPDRKYFDYVADPATLQILMRPRDSDSCFVLLTATTAAQFWSLRPCVVLAGKMDVQISSDATI